MPPDQYLRKQCLELANRPGMAPIDVARAAAVFEAFVLQGRSAVVPVAKEPGQSS